MPTFDELDCRGLAMALDALARALKSIRDEQSAGNGSGNRDPLAEAIADLKSKWEKVVKEQYGGSSDDELLVIQDAITVLERMR